MFASFCARAARAGFALALVAPVHLLAQSTAPVPWELAAAFARSIVPADSEAAVDFSDARVPATIESFVHLPASARVLGTINVGRTSYVLATTSLAPDSALHAIAHDYGAANWEGLSSVRVVAGNVPSVGGFRPAPAAFPSTFCHDSVEVIATARRGDARRTDVRLRVSEGTAVCARLSNMAHGATAPPKLPTPRGALPMLVDPAGASMSVQCFADASTNSTQTRFQTSMSLDSLVDHYGKQLETQGWQPSMTAAPLIRKLWTRRDPSGITETTELTVGVSPLAPSCREAAMIVSTPRSR